MFRLRNIKRHSQKPNVISSMLLPKLFVNAQVSLPYKNTNSTNARNVHDFKDLDRGDCQILFSLLQDFPAKAFLAFFDIIFLVVYPCS